MKLRFPKKKTDSEKVLWTTGSIIEKHKDSLAKSADEGVSVDGGRGI